MHESESMAIYFPHYNKKKITPPKMRVHTSCTESRAVTTYRQMRQMPHAQKKLIKKMF